MEMGNNPFKRWMGQMIGAMIGSEIQDSLAVIATKSLDQSNVPPSSAAATEK
jgi:hypothetical protein